MRTKIHCLFVVACLASAHAADTGLAPGVRGLVTRATGPVTMDGKLDEWAGAFCTPTQHNHHDLDNRAAQLFYMWDDDNFYLGLRAQDQKRADVGDLPSLWNGDAIEFYFDTRSGDQLRAKDWTDGAVHLFLTAFDKVEVKPRWTVRGGIATSNVKLEGIEIVAALTDYGYEMEFKLPWKNFPNFKTTVGALIGIDGEMCSGDGGGRADRTFTYGSPLSVTQPASQGKIQLVNKLEDKHLLQVAAALLPLWVETPWNQPVRAQVVAVMGVAPALADRVAAVEIRIHDLDGKIVKTLPAKIEKLKSPLFNRAVAMWPNDDFAPGTFFVTARALDAKGKVLGVVAPRLVQEAQMSGR